MITRFLALTLAAVLALPLAGQDQLRLPRKELADAIAAAKAARVQELTASLQAVKAAIKSGAKGYGDTRREAVANARMRQTQIEADLKAAKSEEPPLRLDVDTLAVGQIGELLAVTIRPAGGAGRAPALEAGSRGAYRASFGSSPVRSLPLEGEVIAVISKTAAVVQYGGKSLWLRMPTDGLTPGAKVSLREPVKVVGTKTYLSSKVFELAFFEPATP